jgi:peptidoglycan biosynthesis protein MviN/MurJ (putative lipid II flippase)
MVAVVFGRGRFDAQAIDTLAPALASYAPSVVGIALTQVPLGIAYGHQRGWLVFRYFASTSIAMLVTEWGLLRLGAGLASFGWGWVLAFGVTALWFYPQATRWHLWGLFSPRNWLRFVGVSLVTWLATSSVVVIVNQSSAQVGSHDLLTLVTGVIACGSSFIVAGYISRLPEFRQLLSQLISRFLASETR